MLRNKIDEFKIKMNKYIEELYNNIIKTVNENIKLNEGNLNKIIEENFPSKNKEQLFKLKNELLYLYNNKDKKENEIKRENILNNYKIYEKYLTNGLNNLENYIIKLKKNPFYDFKFSKILDNIEEKIMISNWIKPNSKIKFNLLYQISRDGDRMSTFYNKIEGKAPTLILIKTKAGYKCGGYTTVIWSQNDNYKKDELAFIFSIDKKKKYTIKSDKIDYAICGSFNYFAFGVGHDLCIFDQCTTSNNNYCNTPNSFNTTEKYELTGGQYNFLVDECEVYHVQFL